MSDLPLPPEAPEKVETPEPDLMHEGCMVFVAYLAVAFGLGVIVVVTILGSSL